METHDGRVVHARQFLANARTREPDDLLPADLVREDAELRRCLAWVIDVVDDFADTELDENVTQVTYSGGLYIARAEVAGLCGGCLSRLPGQDHLGLARPLRESDQQRHDGVARGETQGARATPAA
jgi:hypothetical protein